MNSKFKLVVQLANYEFSNSEMVTKVYIFSFLFCLTWGISNGAFQKHVEANFHFQNLFKIHFQNLHIFVWSHFQLKKVLHSVKTYVILILQNEYNNEKRCHSKSFYREILRFIMISTRTRESNLMFLLHGI